MAFTWADLRSLILQFPGVEEGTSYGTPAFKVRGKLLTRLNEDGVSLVVKVGLDERAHLMAIDRDNFYITPHYKDWPAMLVRLDGVPIDILRRLLEETWRAAAPKKLVKEYDDAR
ncbi:MAG TPA: MmcQ/YjbR family DNA-binding protein [Aliidongia sp.]|nr:MmcQ/YjbR family DNA-binding protein [Aliidongia sp.]